MTIKVLGIDLGKRYFHVNGEVERGNSLRRKFTRKQLIEFFSNLPP